MTSARLDSFVVENNARWPTDMSLLRDAVRAGVNLGAKELQKAGLPGWQKSETDTASVKAAFNLVRKVGSASEDDVKAYLEICKPFVAWMEKTAVVLASRGSDLESIKIKPNKIAMLEHSSVARTSCSTRSGGASSRAKRFRTTRSSSRSSCSTRAGYRRGRRAASPSSELRPPLPRTSTASSWRRS